MVRLKLHEFCHRCLDKDTILHACQIKRLSLGVFICHEGLLDLLDGTFIHRSRRFLEFVRISLKNAEVEGVWGVDSCWVLAVSTKLVKIEAGVEVVVAGLAASSNSDPEMDAGVVGTSVQHTHDSHGHTYSNPNDVVSLVNTAPSIVITVPSI